MLAFLLIIYSTQVKSQDLEPRFLSSVPMKSNFAGIIYGYSSGDILLNAQEIENLNAKLNNVAIFYGRSFKMLNKPTKIDIVAPYSFGELNAFVSSVDTSVYKNGASDPTIRFSMILVGDKALSLQEFAKREKKKFKFGTALKIKLPLGRYDDSKLINLGSNRWGFQLKAAASYWVSKKLILEYHIDSWFFTENTSFFNVNTLKQKPLLSTQLHVAYLFSQKFWSSASFGQVAWGETSINGIEQDNNQVNSRYGFTASYRLSNLGLLKIAVTNGLYTASGVDFTTFLLSYSFLWFDKKN